MRMNNYSKENYYALLISILLDVDASKGLRAMGLTEGKVMKKSVNKTKK